MAEKSRDVPIKANRDEKREETARAFAEIKQNEEMERREKTMRLRRLRLVQEQHD